MDHSRDTGREPNVIPGGGRVPSAKADEGGGGTVPQATPTMALVATEGTPPEPTATPDTPTALAQPRLSPRQIIYLLTVASQPLATTQETCEAMTAAHGAKAPHENTLNTWRKHPDFRALHDAIRRDPQVAASFLLAWSQPDVIARWRRNLGEGARVSTDAGRALATEQRLRGEGKARAKLADLIAHVLESQG